MLYLLYDQICISFQFSSLALLLHAKRFFFYFRSVSDDVTRTPIQVDKISLESTPKTKAPAFWDPRSPSNEPGLTRTPIVLSQARAPLNLDQDSYDDSKEDIIAAPPPSRGAVADLKDIEAKVENLQLKDDVEEAETNEKEDGEITHDCNDSKNDGKNSVS